MGSDLSLFYPQNLLIAELQLPKIIPDLLY